MRRLNPSSQVIDELVRIGQKAAKPLKQVGHFLGKAYVNKLTHDEFEYQPGPRRNERAIEYQFVFRSLIKTGAKTVLDVGTGDTALPHLLRTCGCHVTAIDNVDDYWPKGMINRHWYVLKDDIREPKLKGPFDLITCISVIEHIEDHLSPIIRMVRMLAPKGHLVLTTPYSERRSVPNVYAEPGAAYGQDLPYICRSSSRKELTQWLGATGTGIVIQEYWRCWTGPFWAQGQRYPVPEKATPDETHQLTCLLLRRGRPALSVGS